MWNHIDIHYTKINNTHQSLFTKLKLLNVFLKSDRIKTHQPIYKNGSRRYFFFHARALNDTQLRIATCWRTKQTTLTNPVGISMKQNKNHRSNCNELSRFPPNTTPCGLSRTLGCKPHTPHFIFLATLSVVLQQMTFFCLFIVFDIKLCNWIVPLKQWAFYFFKLSWKIIFKTVLPEENSY